MLDGPQADCFSIWERRRGGGRNLTFPSRAYVVSGDHRSFALLRPIGDATAQRHVRDRIPESWVDFMMRFELGLESQTQRAPASALTIADAYIVGGLIPLAPYFAVASAARALSVSVGFTLVALFVFGYAKGRFTGASPLRSALQTTLVGGLAAAAAFAIRARHLLTETRDVLPTAKSCSTPRRGLRR